MNSIRKIFAVLFAFTAVMLMQTVIFADTYGFTVQPEGGQTLKNAKYTVTWTTTFTPTKIIIKEGSEEKYMIADTAKTMSFDLSPNTYTGTGWYLYYIYAYYDSTNYVKSSGFLIKEYDPKFEISPLSEVLGSSGSKTVYWETNFTPVKQYLLQNDTQYQNLTATATSVSVSASDYVYKIRAYYTATEYIDSKPFQITATPKFTLKPSDVYGLPNIATSVFYDVNFYPVKVTLIYSSGSEGSSFPERTYDYSVYSDKRYVYDYPSEFEKKIRVYYNSDDYIESNTFKILKSSTTFTKQPENGSAGIGEECFVSWTTNFTQKKVDIIQNGEIVKTLTGDVKSTALPPSNTPYQIRAWWNDSGNYSYYSIDSEKFNINLSTDAKFTSEPIGKGVPANSTAAITFKTNFSPKKLQVIFNNKFYRELSTTATNTYLPPYTNYYGSQLYKIRAYWGTGENDYLDSRSFAVWYTYKISFDNGGGSGTMTQVTKASGYEYTWDECTFTAPDSNKLFDKWLCSADNKYYYPGEKYTYDFGKDITLTAVWKSKKISSIYVEIENFENAVHGHNVEEFRNITSDDRQITASNVKWSMFNKDMSDTAIYLNENFNVSFEIDTKDGFELADTVNCYVRNVKGSTISATRVTGNNTITHAKFYFAYKVPAPEGGIYINETKARTLDEPVAGRTPATSLAGGSEVRTENYSSTVTWSPNDTIFGNKIYTATITLTPNEYYYFDENSVITINNTVLPAEIDSSGNAVVKIVFIKQGDLNCDGAVTEDDAVLLCKSVLADDDSILPVKSLLEDYMKIADMDNDKILTANDSALILEKVAQSKELPED